MESSRFYLSMLLVLLVVPAVRANGVSLEDLPAEHIPADELFTVGDGSVEDSAPAVEDNIPAESDSVPVTSPANPKPVLTKEEAEKEIMGLFEKVFRTTLHSSHLAINAAATVLLWVGGHAKGGANWLGDKTKIDGAWGSITDEVRWAADIVGLTWALQHYPKATKTALLAGGAFAGWQAIKKYEEKTGKKVKAIFS